MKFCKQCNSVMKPIQIDKKDILKCINPDCNYEEDITKDSISSNEIIPKKPERKQGIVEDKNIYATYDDFKCSKCGYNKAEVIERQPYISDEDSLTFLKCGKCKNMQQLARKTS